MHITRNRMVRRAAAILVTLALAAVAAAPIAADEGILEVPASPRVVAFFEDQGISSATVGKTYDELTRDERRAIWAIENDAALSETLKSLVSASLTPHLRDGIVEVRMLVAGSVFTVTRY